MPLLMHPLAAAFPAGRCFFESMLLENLFDLDCCARDVSDARVRATKHGWTLTVSLPGLSASEVTVEARSSTARHRCKIRVHALPRFDAEYVLPTDSEVAAASASLIDGQLTVAVPISASKPVAVPVTEGDAPTAGEADQENTLQLNVPGFSAYNIFVAADLHTRTLTVEGRRTVTQAGPDFSRVLKLRADADVEQFSASAKDGVLRLRLPRRAPEEYAVAVSANRQHLQPTAGEQSLSQLPVPGVSAEEVTAKLVRAANGHLSLHLTATNARRSMQQCVVRVPEGVQVEGVRVACCDGLLAVIIATPVPQKPESVTLPLSSTVPATLPSSPHAATMNTNGAHDDADEAIQHEYELVDSK